MSEKAIIKPKELPLKPKNNGWLNNNIVNPLINSAIIEPEQAISNTVNAISGQKTLTHLNNLPQDNANFLTPTWFIQNIASGAGMIVPYMLIGKSVNIGLSSIGESIEVKGLTASILQNDVLANSLGASAYGFAQDVGSGQSRIGNAIGQGLSFGIYGVGDGLIKNYSLPAKIPGLAIIGASGASSNVIVSTLISSHQLPTVQTLFQASVSGASLNLAMPAITESMGKLSHVVNNSLNRGDLVNTYLKENFEPIQVAKSLTLNSLTKQNPWVRILDNQSETKLIDGQIILKSSDKNISSIAHELAHADNTNSMAPELVQAKIYLTLDNPDKAYHSFIKACLENEIKARQIEDKVNQEINPQFKIKSNQEIIQEIINNPTYLNLWQNQFNEFKLSNGEKTPQEFLKNTNYHYLDFIQQEWGNFDDNKKLAIIHNIKGEVNNVSINILVNGLNDSENSIIKYAQNSFAKLEPKIQTQIFDSLIKNPDLSSKVAAARLIQLLPRSQRIFAFKEFFKNSANLGSDKSYLTKERQTDWKKLNNIRKIRNSVVESIASFPNKDRLEAFSLAFNDPRSRYEVIANLDLLPKSSQYEYWHQIFNNLSKLYYHDDNFYKMQKGLVKSLNGLAENNLIEGFNQLIPYLHKFDPNELLGSFDKLPNLNKIETWCKMLDQVAINKDNSQITEFLAKAITKLPENERVKSWYRLAKIKALVNPNDLLNSINSLPETNHINALKFVLQNYPQDNLDYSRYLTHISLSQYPQVIETLTKYETYGGDRNLKNFLKSAKYSHSNEAETNSNDFPLKIQTLINSIEANITHPETYTNFKSLYSEIAEPNYDENNIDNTIRSFLSQNIDPKTLAKIFFYHDPQTGIEIAAKYPEFIKTIAKSQAYTMEEDDQAVVKASQTFLATNNLEQSINALLSVYAKDNLDYPKEETISYVIPELFKYLAKDASTTDKIKTLQYLKTLFLNNFSDKSTSMNENKYDNLKEHSVITKEIAITIANSLKPGAESEFNEYFLRPINEVLNNPNTNYEYKVKLANLIGHLTRNDLLPNDLIQTPNLRMQPQFNWSTAEQNHYRSISELALHGDLPMNSILGDNGILGKLYPQIFGDYTTSGGIVDRPQHGFHEFVLDKHIAKVIERVRNNSEFNSLSNDDQTNVLWAALIHDIGKEANVVDPDHDLKSTNMSYGILKDLGYSNIRILRIMALLSHHADVSYNPYVHTYDKLQNDSQFADSMVNIYRSPVTHIQTKILNEADIKSINSTSSYYTDEVNQELKNVRKFLMLKSKELNSHLTPLLTTKIPQQFAITEFNRPYALLAHQSRYLDSSFIDQLPLIESTKYSMSTSLITPNCNYFYHTFNDASIFAIIESPMENISQAYHRNLGTGRSIDDIGHIELTKFWPQERNAKDFKNKINNLLQVNGINQSLDNILPDLFKYDSYDSIIKDLGENSTLAKTATIVHEALTTDESGKRNNEHNEVKINNPLIAGFGVLRRGQNIAIETKSMAELKSLFLSGQVPSYVHLKDNSLNPNELTISQKLIAAAQKKQIPILILDP